MSQKIAIIGGSGFIGTALVHQLKALHPNDDIKILDIQPSATFPDLYTYMDVTDSKAVHDALKGTDVIYHLAAAHRDDVKPVQKYYDVNVGGAKNIIAAATAHDIRHIIFTSTVAVYGLNAGESRESDTPDPFNDYGQSKLDSEHIFNEWANAHKDNTLTTLRFVATFGAGNRGNIYTLIDQIARRKFVMIGNGNNHKSIAYVGNVAAFLAMHLEQEKGSSTLYNYADKPDLSMNELVTAIRQTLNRPAQKLRIPSLIGLSAGYAFDTLSRLTNKNYPISAIRVRKFMADTVVNADKAHSIFNAPHTITDGLNLMITQDF